ncbi:hypothetical protein Bca101_016568 [Brassica carinata]
MPTRTPRHKFKSYSIDTSELNVSLKHDYIVTKYGLRHAFLLRPIYTIFYGTLIKCSPSCSSFVFDRGRDYQVSVTVIVV